MKAWFRAHPDEAGLSFAIAALLVAAVVSMILLPHPGEHIAFSREQGTLLAPSSDDDFSAAMSAPSDPSSAFGVPPEGGNSNPPAPTPGPTTHGPATPGPATPGPTQTPTPEPPCGLLCELPLIPPPPPHGAANGHGAAR
jgi:hypothetical protein